MGVVGPGGWQGRPNRGVIPREVFAGSDVLLGLTFINSEGTPTEPTSIQYRIDSLTSVQPIIGWTSVTPTGTEQTLQLQGSVLQITRSWYGRELFQVWIQAVIPDTGASSGTITVNQIVCLELIAISTPC